MLYQAVPNFSKIKFALAKQYHTFFGIVATINCQVKEFSETLNFIFHLFFELDFDTLSYNDMINQPINCQ